MEGDVEVDGVLGLGDLQLTDVVDDDVRGRTWVRGLQLQAELGTLAEDDLLEGEVPDCVPLRDPGEDIEDICERDLL